VHQNGAGNSAVFVLGISSFSEKSGYLAMNSSP
jgi:hypothetical protein